MTKDELIDEYSYTAKDKEAKRLVYFLMYDIATDLDLIIKFIESCITVENQSYLYSVFDKCNKTVGVSKEGAWALEELY